MPLLRRKPYRTHSAARELSGFRRGGAAAASIYTIDEEMGFRPRLGTAHYTEFGTHPNDYPLAKSTGRQRLLFLGDSVTARHAILDALRVEYGEQGFEYWNAGVDSFNTRQEVEFFRRYNRRIDPDHVILTFHLNDFESTPVAFEDAAGHLVVYAPKTDRTRVHRWAFEHLHLYRVYLGLLRDDTAAVEEQRAAVRAALHELQALVVPARLSVVVFPYATPVAHWTEEQRESHRFVVAELAALKIRCFPLLEVLERALADGVDVQQAPGDTWHPSDAFARRIAAHLRARGLLD